MATLWNAQPHTLAKIEMLRSFLFSWFSVHGQRARGQDLVYIDGFAGPGRYANSSIGSPVAALQAASKVRSNLGQRWIADRTPMYFVEKDRATSSHLTSHLTPFGQRHDLTFRVLNDTFERALPTIELENPAAFAGQGPLFAFVDPFGAKGVPFRAVETILRSPKSEVLINLDADGLVRIFQAGASANAAQILTEVFGDESWRSVLSELPDFRERCLALSALYKAKLRSLPEVLYSYSFEMLTSRKRTGTVGYFLVFASQHPRGLEKMKEAMKRLDQDGTYQFSNARVNQPMLIRFDRPELFSPTLCRWFEPRTMVSYRELVDFALNETPFTNPKSMLKDLEDRGLIKVHSSDPRRRRGTFPENKIAGIDFTEGCGNG